MAVENIRPLHDRVLIKRLPLEDKTASGIFIPDVAKEKPQKGEVIAVGAGRLATDGKIMPMQVKKGDVVVFGKYAGTETTGEYIILREDEILGVVEL
jgi:chaperonin GroES